MTNSSDPDDQWAHLLHGLEGARRDAVIDTLRHSADSGCPATEDGVRLLVAYAEGEISAQDYAVNMLVSLGLDRLAEPQPEPVLEPALVRAASRWSDEPSPAPAPVAEAPTPTPTPTPPPDPTPEPEPEPGMTREEAVDAYVAGRIAIEDFLRIARGLPA